MRASLLGNITAQTIDHDHDNSFKFLHSVAIVSEKKDAVTDIWKGTDHRAHMEMYCIFQYLDSLTVLGHFQVFSFDLLCPEFVVPFRLKQIKVKLHILHSMIHDIVHMV